MQLFNFLNENKDNSSAEDFAQEAVHIFNEGGDVEFDCSDPKPDKLSFCKKVWYLDMDEDGYYSEMKEAEIRPGINWFENLTEKDCDDKRSCVKDDCEKVDWYLDNDGDQYYKEMKNDYKSCKPEGNWNMTSDEGEDCDDGDAKYKFEELTLEAGSIYNYFNENPDLLSGDLTFDDIYDIIDNSELSNFQKIITKFNFTIDELYEPYNSNDFYLKSLENFAELTTTNDDLIHEMIDRFKANNGNRCTTP